jgi:hypothetical protein
MSINGPSKTINDGLILSLDAANIKSYVGSGTAWNDLSKNGNNGTLTNGPVFSTANGGSFAFDGINDYVTVPDVTMLRTFSAMTLDVYVKYVTTSSNQIFAQKWNYSTNNGYGLEIYQGNILGYCMNPSGAYPSASSVSFPAGRVHNFSMTYSGTTQALYANGNLLMSTANGNVPSTTGYDFRIGYRSSGGLGDAPFSGSIYCVKMYNRALSASEILKNYNSIRTRFGI